MPPFSIRFLPALFLLCSSAVFATDPVLVQGGGVTITANDVLADAQRMPLEARNVALARPSSVTQTGNNLYVRRVFAKDAEREGLASDPAVLSALQLARDKVLSDAWLLKLDAANTPSESVLDALALSTYNANPKRFEAPAQVRARHILVRRGPPDARATADKLLLDLKAGADFATLAKEHSGDTGSAVKGGDLGFFGTGRMVPAFDKAVFALSKPGELSEVVETDFGFHIIRLEESRPAGVRPFAEVRESLRRELSAKLLNEARAKEQKRVLDTATPDKAAIDAFAAVPR